MLPAVRLFRYCPVQMPRRHPPHNPAPVHAPSDTCLTLSSATGFKESITHLDKMVGRSADALFASSRSTGAERLLDCLQKCILCSRCHFLRIRHNINFIFSTVWLDQYIVHNLCSHIIHADAVWLFVHQMYDVRMVAALCLYTRMAAATRLCASLFTLQCFRKNICQLFAASLFSTQYIRMGHLPSFAALFRCVTICSCPTISSNPGICSPLSDFIIRIPNDFLLYHK